MSTLVASVKDFVRSLERPERRVRVAQKGGHALWIVARTVFLIGMSFVLLYPLLMALSISFRAPGDLMDPSVVWIPKNFSLANMEHAWKDMVFWVPPESDMVWTESSLWQTITLSLVSSMLQIASCAWVAYGFARFKFPFKNLMFALVVFTIVVPEQVLYIPKYLLYSNFGILNTNFVMYLPAFLGVGIRSGLFIYILNQFYRNLPKELEEAAYIDGCNSYGTFFRIVLPNARNSMITVFLFSVVWYWNDYYQSSMYFVNKNTLSTMLSRLVNTVAVNMTLEERSPILQSGSLLMVVPMLILFIIFERYFTEGLERSGIVG